jgi:hypothetical protein
LTRHSTGEYLELFEGQLSGFARAQGCDQREFFAQCRDAIEDRCAARAEAAARPHCITAASDWVVVLIVRRRRPRSAANAAPPSCAFLCVSRRSRRLRALATRVATPRV